MSVSAATLRTHIDYSAWASRHLVDAAAQLSPEELVRDFQTADRSVLDTLVHVYAADRLWLSRLNGGPHPGFVTDADRSLSVLQTEWPRLHESWKQWAAELTDETALAPLAYTDMKGRPWSQPLWQLVLHVVNHGTHHRGQVSGFLRSMGRTPPAIDLIFYYRERPSGTDDRLPSSV
ncbi:MAG: DinB family protein, partial [Acidobacteriia bacterium]|nr:DinB family protein [Terriglobia bacterium]